MLAVISGQRDTRQLLGLRALRMKAYLHPLDDGGPIQKIRVNNRDQGTKTTQGVGTVLKMLTVHFRAGSTLNHTPGYKRPPFSPSNQHLSLWQKWRFNACAASMWKNIHFNFTMRISTSSSCQYFLSNHNPWPTVAFAARDLKTTL